MFSHVTAGTNNLQKSVSFYDTVLATLGLKQLFFWPEKAAAYGAKERGPKFFVCQPYNGNRASVGNGVTIGFNASSRSEVDAFHAAVLANGGSDEGTPGLRDYHPNYYGAYARDPDGNKLCCACHLPE